MTAEVGPQAPVQRPSAQRASSWRDKVSAEYEISQARLRYLVEEEPEEFL